MVATIQTTVAHPLEPLGPEEIEAAVAILRREKGVDDRFRFISLTLHEPPKDAVLGFKPGQQVAREAFAVLLDRTAATTCEAIVSVTFDTVRSWEVIPDVQPAISFAEFFECEQAVKLDARWQEALRKRGVTNFDLAMVDPWSGGNYGDEDEALKGRRISRALTWVRTRPEDNGYAHPVQNVVAIVDLNKREVIRVEDYGVVPIPWTEHNYDPEAAGKRAGLKELMIHQPDGPSFDLDGHCLSWQKWQMRIGYTPREGLVLHTVTYNDQGRERPILYRASIVDMVIPYGDPRPAFFRRNAFDVGEYGIGGLGNALELGCDCLGEIRYLDAHMTDTDGSVYTIKNAVCIHEEDFGILWKHVDFRTGATEVRRSRRLVVSFIATVGNYEYGFYWYFYQDGNIEHQVKMTGVLSNGAEAPGAPTPKWGEYVAPQVYAPIHQHIFNARLDMMVDGPNNSVYEVNTVADPPGPENPHHNAFHAEPTLLARESQAQRVIDPLAARFWKVVNPSANNALGNPVAYKLMPGDNVLPFASSEAAVIKRAGFMTKHVWVTAFDENEKYAAGDYPNQHAGGAGLPEYVQADRSLEDTDVVLWYTFGAHHIPRPEDWPVMPAAMIGFMLKPVGFFDRNPGLDVPRPMMAHRNGNGHH